VGCFVPEQEGAAFSRFAESGKADSLVTGRCDLLVLSGQMKFLIESPDAYRRRCLEA
jgi:hypothetical protein